MTMQEAIKKVREAFPDSYILSGLEYNGSFDFTLLSKDYETMYSDQTMRVSVEQQTGKVVRFNAPKILADREGYNKARKKAISIDTVDLSKLKKPF